MLKKHQGYLKLSYINILKHKTQRNKQKQNQTKENKRKSLELIPQNGSSSSFIFYRSPQLNLFIINKIVISNLKLKDQVQKRPQAKEN